MAHNKGDVDSEPEFTLDVTGYQAPQTHRPSEKFDYQKGAVKCAALVLNLRHPKARSLAHANA